MDRRDAGALSEGGRGEADEGATAVRPARLAFRPMVPARVSPYPRTMTTAPQEQAPVAETELSETEAAEIEARLRDLGYIE